MYSVNSKWWSYAQKLFPVENVTSVIILKKTLCRSHVACKGFFSMTTLWFDKFFENWKKNLACHMWSGKGVFSMTTLSFDEIFRIFWFWFFNRKILFIIEVGNYKLYNLWICYKGMAFWDGDNFFKAIPKNYILW